MKKEITSVLHIILTELPSGLTFTETVHQLTEVVGI